MAGDHTIAVVLSPLLLLLELLIILGGNSKYRDSRKSHRTPHPERAVGVLFSSMVSRWAGGWQEKVCPGYISETVSCIKFKLGRDNVWGCR